jgi:hypothetical protein
VPGWIGKHDVPDLGKRATEIAAHVRMRDRDQRLGPLAETQTEQVHGAVLILTGRKLNER